MSDKCLTVQNLNFSYGERSVLKEINLEVFRGDFISVVGVSGSGKSTLLKILAGDYKASGLIRKNGVFKRVHQTDGLFPWLTVLENIRLGLRDAPADCENDIDELTQTLGLAQHLHSYPRELSGGLRQRVELARALVGRPDGLLLDEPFSSLDYLTRRETREYLAQVLAKRKTTVIMVTHDIPEALFFSNKVLLLSGNPATVKKTFSQIDQSQNLVEEIWQELH